MTDFDIPDLYKVSVWENLFCCIHCNMSKYILTTPFFFCLEYRVFILGLRLNERKFVWKRNKTITMAVASKCLAIVLNF